MRATIRITWLLLSLSFLLHNVSSDGTDPTDSSVSKGPTTAATVAVVVTSVGSSGTEITTKKMGSTTGASPTEKPTQAPTTIKPTSAPPLPTVVANTQPKPTDNPATTQPQTPAVTNKPASDPTTISGGPSAVEKDTTVPATTPSPPKPTTPAATADSSRPSVVAPSAATTQKPEAPVTTKIPVTEAPNRPTGSTSKVETTQDPKVLTYASTQTQKPVAHTTNPSLTSQGNGKRGTEKTTVTVKSHEQTTLKTPEPAVITGTTSSNPSTSTKAGLPPVATPKEATTSLQTTTVRTTRATTTVSQPRTFLYSLNTGHETDEEKELVDVCKRLMVNLQDGDCTLKLQHHNGKIQFDSVEIRGKVKTSLAAQYYEEITKKPTDNKTLIAILASCGALLIMIVILAVCASHRRKPYNENQQHLTEELHTVENGYHDNPTLEVMEVQPEMQEKKMPLNGEFNDSWIVPMDNLPKGCEDIPEEEDTHL